MGKHTPGPWQLDDESEVHKEGAIIARVMMPDDFPCLDEDADLDALADECAANANLITAAPDLLAACKRAKECIDRMGLDWLGKTPDPLAAAIDKAEGRQAQSPG